MTSIQTATRYVVGVDLGQKFDYTAITVLRQHLGEDGRKTYDGIYLDRWRGRNYEDTAPALQKLTSLLQAATQREYQEAGLVNQPDLPIRTAVDYTGVGLGVVDVLRNRGIRCTGITITSGNQVNRSNKNYRVPKKDLVTQVELLLESRRLTIAGELPLADVLVAELDNFKSKTNLDTGHDSYGAGAEWREGNHDDLVLATAIAGWYGEHVREPGKIVSV